MIFSNFGSDLVPFYLPDREFGFSQLRQGHIPFWNPYVYSGSPYFIDFQNALFYPPNWIFLFLDTRIAINTSIVMHVFMAGLFAFLWFAHRRLHPAACLLGGVVFMLCGPYYLQISEGHLSNFCTMTWIPLILLAVEGWRENRTTRWLALGVLSVTLQILAGHPQYVFYTFLAVGAYGLVLLPGTKGKWKFLAGLAFFYLFSACLVAVQLLPTLFSLPETLRGHGFQMEEVYSFSLPPENILTLFLPQIWGGAMDYFGRGDYGETSLFMGVTAFWLSLTGLFLSPKESRIPFLLAFLAFLLALGPQTFLFRGLFDLFPFSQGFRAAYRFGLFTPFFLGITAVLQLHRLFQGEKVPRFLPLLAGAMGGISLLSVPFFPALYMSSLIRFGLLSLLFAASLWAAEKTRRGRNSLLFLLVLIGLCELILFARDNRPVFDYRQFEARQSALNTLSLSIPADARIYAPFGDTVGPFDQGIWGFNNMVLYRYARFIGASQGLPAYVPIAHPIHRDGPPLGLLRYGYRVEDSFKGIQAIPTHLKLMKRAQFIDGFEIKKGENEIISGLLDSRFDPARKVLLEEPPVPMPIPSAHLGRVELKDLSTDEVEIWADLDHPSILLLSDSYSKGWSIQPLDPGAPQPYRILPADLTLKAVPLTAGRHHFLMRYIPPYFELGKWISLVSLAALGLFFARIFQFPRETLD